MLNSGLSLAGGALLSVLLPDPAHALPHAFLVKDINRTPVVFSSEPRQLEAAGERAFFVAESPGGFGLWITDGTTAGTRPVKKIAVIGNLVAIGNRLLFVARDGANGAELWTSDGTEPGTVLVRDIRPGPDDAFDSDERYNTFADAGGTVLFVADDGVHGVRLWRTDGTAAGTVPVDDAHGLQPTGRVLLYPWADDAHGVELWRSDGTAAGTFRLSDINPGPDGSDPTYFTSLDGTVFFSARDAEHGTELWKSDGSEAGTVLVSDLRPRKGNSNPYDLTPVDGELFFRATSCCGELAALWRTDGTALGTVLVRRFADVGFNGFAGAVDLNGRLMSVQADPTHGLELWISDGTEGGTEIVRDINPGSAHAWPNSLTVVNGVVLFTADDGTHGQELWRSDGTPDGTVLVRDIHAGSPSSDSGYLDTFLAFNGHLIFAADDGAHGMELWESDGSEAGLLKDVWPGPATDSAMPASFTAFGDRLFFTAEDGMATKLWKSDGTEAGTVPVADLIGINEGRAPMTNPPLTILSGRLFFGADDRVTGNELWSSDGTSAGTILVKDIMAGPDGSLPGELTPVGDLLFFAADDGGVGRDLWKSDGTSAGTMRVLDGVSPTRLIAVGSRLFFTIGSGADSELWVTDGSPAGTLHLVDAFYIYYLADLAGTLYFTQSTTMWKSDGTVAGTVPVADFHPVSGTYVPNDLTVAGDHLFFAAKPPSGSDVRLWATDGEGFTDLAGHEQFSYNLLTAAADRLFFVSRDAEHGEELWTSDGTAAGTRLARDINPGPDGSSPSALSGGAGPLRFRACGADACRLWESDGTDAGTRPVADIGNLLISTIGSAGELAFFAAEDFVHGAELWAAPLSAAACVGDCDGDGGVTIAELVRMVGVALDRPSAAPCAIGDGAAVSIDRLVRAVGNALGGCRGFPPKPTPTGSRTAASARTSTPAQR